jgi:hypothetical protein
MGDDSSNAVVETIISSTRGSIEKNLTSLGRGKDIERRI